eukprot:COSAG01_NODE_18973_length_1039_cov_26.230851_2_plen_43_part_01
MLKTRNLCCPGDYLAIINAVSVVEITNGVVLASCRLTIPPYFR